MSLEIMVNERNKDHKKYANRGLTGLRNLGNTCYMNSALQCISHCYELNDLLNNKTYITKLNRNMDTVILLEWDRLRQTMWSENCCVIPARFLDKLKRVAKKKNQMLFTGYEQNDITEYLHFIIDCFHNAISREVEMEIVGNINNNQDKMAMKCYQMIERMYSNEYSEIFPIFYGIQVTKINSKESDYCNFIPEPFFNITLSIDSNNITNLRDCFKEYTRVEMLKGDNKIENDETQRKEVAEKNITFWCLPQILILSFKRFHNNNRKIQKLIDFPLTDLNLSEYVEGYDKESYKYDLYGICNHMGNVNGGHYTAHVKNMNGMWYNFNDSSVSPINDVNVLKSNYAYCLFYRKKKL